MATLKGNDVGEASGSVKTLAVFDADF